MDWFNMALLVIAVALSVIALFLLIATKTNRYAVKTCWKDERKSKDPLLETWHELGLSFDTYNAMKRANRKIYRLMKKLGCCSTLDTTKVLFEYKYGVWVQVGTMKENNND